MSDFLKSRILFAADDGQGGGSDGGTGGDTGGSAGEIDTSSPVFLKALEAAVADEKALLVKNNEEIVKEKRNLTSALEKFKNVNPDEYRELKKEKEAEETRKLEAEKNWEALKTDLVQKHTESQTKSNDRESQLLGNIGNILVDLELTKAIEGQGGTSRFLLPEFKRHIKVFEENGNFIAKVVNLDSGNPRISDDKGTLMTVEQLVTELKAKEEYAILFKGTGTSGGGAGGEDANNNKGGTGITGSRVTPDQLTELAKKITPEELQKKLKNKEITVIR